MSENKKECHHLNFNTLFVFRPFVVVVHYINRKTICLVGWVCEVRFFVDVVCHVY